MTWLSHTLIFLISLPVSMWLLAQCCALFDQERPSRYLLRALLGICALLLFLLATERGWWLPIALSFGFVCVCHTLGFWLAQRIGVGVPIVESRALKPQRAIEPVVAPTAPTAAEHD